MLALHLMKTFMWSLKSFYHDGFYYSCGTLTKSKIPITSIRIYYAFYKSLIHTYFAFWLSKLGHNYYSLNFWLNCRNNWIYGQMYCKSSPSWDSLQISEVCKLSLAWPQLSSYTVILQELNKWKDSSYLDLLGNEGQNLVIFQQKIWHFLHLFKGSKLNGKLL